jgi:hypothetical protein
LDTEVVNGLCSHAHIFLSDDSEQISEKYDFFSFKSMTVDVADQPEEGAA